jgi:hypothetical protein
MLLIPVETHDHKNDMLIVVLDDTNLERMKAADPAEINLHELKSKLVNPTIFLCHEQPTPGFMKLFNQRDLKAIMKFLQRGWKFRPNKGDHDRGPELLSEGQ